MKTELLNEYIFGTLVEKHAQTIRRVRQQLMEDAGASADEVFNTPLLEQDLVKGFEMLQSLRAESLKLLQESLSEPPK